MNGVDKMGLTILLLATLPFLMVTAFFVRQVRDQGKAEGAARPSKALLWLSGGIVAFVILIAVAMWIVGQAVHGAVGGLL